MKSRPDPGYQHKKLTGHTALAVNGMPAEFAAQCMFILSKYNITAAWRVGEHAEPDKITTEKKRITIDIASHPKPSDVTEKSSNWGFTRWFIADNPLLGKYDEDGNPVNVGAKRSARTAPIEHYISLRFILSEISKKTPTMRFESISHDNQLIITCLDAPKGAPAVYRVNLNRGIQPVDVDAAALQVLPDSPRDVPEWWPEHLHFAGMLDQRFPVEYRANDNTYHPVKVSGIRDMQTNEVTPIITDMDLLWVSEPDEDNPLVKMCNEKRIPLFDVMNTHNENEKNALLSFLKQIVEIDNELYHDNPEQLDKLNLSLVADDVLSRMGCVTPFTAYFILLVNQRFRKFVGHVDDLMQHSAEIFNPYKPSILGATLNINRGMIVETFCEEDQIQFAQELIEQGYHLRIHPKWDMNKWGVIVEKMKLRGDRIPPEINAAYNHHIDQLDQQSQSPVPILLRKASRKLSLAATGFFRRSSGNIEHKAPMRRDSTGVFIVQARCPDININDDSSSLLGNKKVKLLKEFCSDHTQHAAHEKWKQPDSSTIELTISDEANPPQMYKFRIDAMRISLIAGDANSTSIGALKKLSEMLFDGKKIEILAATQEITEFAQNAFAQPKSLRPH